ncbi:MAG: hypothetical protein AB7S26_22535 [Sandaracinaceae bacterium]
MRRTSHARVAAGLALGLGLITALGLGASAGAQPPNPPRDASSVSWSVFVGGLGRPGRRTTIGTEPGSISLGDSPWRCGYASVRVAAIGSTDWSAQRVLACERGEASVSATASCRVHGGAVEEHAATLSLGTTGESEHLTVTLGCQAAR